MKRMTALFLPVLIICVAETYALPPAATGYGLAWSDEFNGTSLDTINNWSFDTVDFSNAITQRYTRSCVAVENGNLVIWSKYDPNVPGFLAYTSGRIDSHDKKIFTYGYFEASIKAPLGQVSGPGLWSAVWLLGNSINHGITWPTCGEMELYDQRPSNAVVRPNTPQPVPATIGDNEFIACCHYANANGGPSYHSCQYDYPTALSDRFHTYGVFWDSLHVEYYFDDTLFWGVNYPIVNDTNFGVPDINLPENKTAFHSPFYWIINVAVGGAYQGQNINNAIFPTKMLIDYVRVYQSTVPVVKNPRAQHAQQSFALVNPSSARLKVFSLTGKLVADYTDKVRAMRAGDNALRALPLAQSSNVYVVGLYDNGRCISRKFMAAR